MNVRLVIAIPQWYTSTIKQRNSMAANSLMGTWFVAPECLLRTRTPRSDNRKEIRYIDHAVAIDVTISTTAPVSNGYEDIGDINCTVTIDVPSTRQLNVGDIHLSVQVNTIDL
jgi:hypothetical protein